MLKESLVFSYEQNAKFIFVSFTLACFSSNYASLKNFAFSERIMGNLISMRMRMFLFICPLVSA